MVEPKPALARGDEMGRQRNVLVLKWSQRGERFEPRAYGRRFEPTSRAQARPSAGRGTCEPSLLRC